MNIEHDIREVGVQMILLVEDSIRFYSSILPNLYSYILTQSQNFATEALTRHDASLRQRGRPKVVLARNYKEAWDPICDSLLVMKKRAYNLPRDNQFILSKTLRLV